MSGPAAELPYRTAELAGTGGSIKLEPDDFVVEEIALYEPCGSGEHVYVRLTRRGAATRDVAAGLAKLFGIAERDVGYAGLKDKQARATQTFSLPLPGADAREVARQIGAELGYTVESSARHGNKLRRGHLLGNRFRVRVAGVVPDAFARAQRIAAALEVRGLANFFGPQRFGARGRNAERGRELLADEGHRARTRTWLGRLELSALQSELFNRWLELRIERGSFECLLPGDVAKKTDTGGLFDVGDVADVAAETPRFDRREITYTGPIYGARMRWPSGVAEELERAVLAAAELDLQAFARAKLDGSRRAARIFASGLEIAAGEGALELEFHLPKGAYATVLLREFIKQGGLDARGAAATDE